MLPQGKQLSDCAPGRILDNIRSAVEDRKVTLLSPQEATAQTP